MRVVARLVLAAAILHLALIQPNHPDAVTWRALILFPLELPALLIGLALLGGGGGGLWLRRGLAALLAAVVILKGADLALFIAFGRGFNPVADGHLIVAGFHLLSGTTGPVLAIPAFALLAGLCLGLWWVLAWAMAVWAGAGQVWQGRSRRLGAGAVAVLFAGLAVYETTAIMSRWAMPWNPPGAAFTLRLGAEEVRLVARSLRDIREFRIAAAQDPFRGEAGLLDRIDRDVIVVFIESYGRASLEQPLYAPTTLPILRRGEAALAEAGVAMRSGFLASPTRGGQSWLAHATFASGLRIGNHPRHQALVASGREGLFHIARRSGFETGAVMPAITMAWPEGERMGFDRIYPAAALGYRGLPFNWVTMPDQYTLSALDRLFPTTGPGEGRRFTQVVLISSHAPWVPVPRLVPWDQVGDGTIFNPMAQEGDPPEVVWRDRDRVRDQYRQAVGYSLEVVLDWALRRAAAEMPLVIVVGDHQAAGFVALEERPDVPVHVIGPEHLVEVAEEWGLVNGLVPPAELEPVPMEAMRDRIVRGFTGRALP